MSRDPRSYDPFRPRRAAAPVSRDPAPAPEAPAAPPVSVDAGLGGPEVQLPPDLERLRKDELIALAEQHGAPTDGTKAELVQRLLDL